MGTHVLDRQTLATLPAQRQPETAVLEPTAVIPEEITQPAEAAVYERAKLWRLRLAAGVLATGAVTTSVCLVECVDNSSTPTTISAPAAAK